MKYKNIVRGYVYDKRIFWGSLFLCLLLFGVIAYMEDFKFNYNFYFECDKNSCDNPLLSTEIKNSITGYNYKNQCTAPWCAMETLPRGIYGKKTNPLLKWYPYISMSFIIIALIVNHLIYNRGKTPEISLNLPEKLKQKLKNMEE